MPVVATAAVQSLEAWLEEQWKELQWGGAADNPETRFLLPRPTALLLWERVIAEDGAGGARPGLSDDFATELLDLPRRSDIEALNENLRRVSQALENLDPALGEEERDPK